MATLSSKGAILYKGLPFVMVGALINAYAEEKEPYLTNPVIPTQNVMIENANLSAKDFFSTYTNKSFEKRRYAELYLLGVLDATEGKQWCDYRTVKTISIDEQVYEGFKVLTKVDLEKRAAHVITKILSDRLPCRKK